MVSVGGIYLWILLCAGGITDSPIVAHWAEISSRNARYFHRAAKPTHRPDVSTSIRFSNGAVSRCEIRKYSTGLPVGVRARVFSRCPLGTDTYPIASVVPGGCTRSEGRLNSYFCNWLRCLTVDVRGPRKLDHFGCEVCCVSAVYTVRFCANSSGVL